MKLTFKELVEKYGTEIDTVIFVCEQSYRANTREWNAKKIFLTLRDDKDYKWMCYFKFGNKHGQSRQWKNKDNL